MRACGPSPFGSSQFPGAGSFENLMAIVFVGDETAYGDDNELFAAGTKLSACSVLKLLKLHLLAAGICPVIR